MCATTPCLSGKIRSCSPRKSEKVLQSIKMQKATKSSPLIFRARKMGDGNERQERTVRGGRPGIRDQKTAPTTVIARAKRRGNPVGLAVCFGVPEGWTAAWGLPRRYAHRNDGSVRHCKGKRPVAIQATLRNAPASGKRRSGRNLRRGGRRHEEHVESGPVLNHPRIRRHGCARARFPRRSRDARRSPCR